MRCFAFERGGYIYLDEASILEVACRVADKEFAFGLMATGPCLAAPFWTFDAYRAEDAQICKNLFVNHSFLVVFNLHLISLLPQMISNFGFEINPIRLDSVFPFGWIRRFHSVRFEQCEKIQGYKLIVVRKIHGYLISRDVRHIRGWNVSIQVSMHRKAVLLSFVCREIRNF